MMRPVTDLAAMAALVVDDAPPADRHPALVYLARLSTGSRRTMWQALDAIAEQLLGRCRGSSADRGGHGCAKRMSFWRRADRPLFHSWLGDPLFGAAGAAGGLGESLRAISEALQVGPSDLLERLLDELAELGDVDPVRGLGVQTATVQPDGGEVVNLIGNG